MPFELFGIYARIVVFEQFRAEVDLTRQMRTVINREHAHAATKPHADMEKLRVQLTIFNVIPQRLLGVVLNTVVSLRREFRQRIRQRARRTAPRFLCQIMGH
ncbi:hypothetical protein D3C81_1337400 [compost metagenome]